MRDEPGRTILEKIVSLRRQSLQEVQSAVPPKQVQRLAEEREERRDFVAALSPSTDPTAVRRLRVIAELKRASPSKGLLRHQYRRREIALGYQNAGAAAISVLTEEQHFLGSTRDLTEVHRAVEIPVLRKDFVLDSYQVYESVAAGADALLLIVAILTDRELWSLLGLCTRLRIAALVEVHTETELSRAVGAGARIIGVNNRDLKTLDVSLETSFRLRERIPPDCVAVSESGIKTVADLRRLDKAGFHAVLVGERLMLEANPGAALSELLTKFAAPAA